MFRKFKTMLFGLLAVVGITTVSAFSVWRYNYETDQTEMNSTNGIDNIKENYSFGADKPQYKTYTMYLFPSSAYGDPQILEKYLDYLNITDQATRKDYIKCPEKMFGVMTAILDDNGLPIYDQNKLPTFKKQVFDDASNSWVDSNDNKGEYDKNYINATLNLDKFESGGTSSTWKTTYLDNTGKRNVANKNNVFTAQELNEINSKSNFRDQVYYCKTHDQLARLVGYGDDPKNNQGIVDGPYGYDWRFQGRTHKREERFGFFGKVKTGEGQFLPEKIVINGAISSEIFKDITFKPFTSMGDENSWYNFTFSGWSYDHTNKAGTSYTPILDKDNQVVWPNKAYSMNAFLSADLDEFFDISQNLAKYADENGVIRLFPNFSNGKTYGAAKRLPQYGGRDGFKLNYKFNPKVVEYANKNDITLPIETYFAYIKDYKDRNQPICNGLENLMYAEIKNVTLMPNLYEELSISSTVAKDSGGWNYGWDTMLRYSNDTLINNTINKYGEGAYNIYLFVGNSCHLDITTTNYFGHYYIDKSKWDTAQSWVNKPISNDISTKSTMPDIGFKTLKNKNLYDFVDNTNANPSFYADDPTYVDVWYDYSTGYVEKTYQHRPVYVCLEKVSDFALYKDLNFRNVKKKGTDPTTGQTIFTSSTPWTDIESEINSKKNSSQSLVNGTNLWYGNIDTDGNFVYDSSIEAAHETTPYIYYVKNVDFTESYNDFFQIRASNQYIDINFNSEPPPNLANKAISFYDKDPTKAGAKILQTFEPAYKNDFIDYVKIETKNSSNRKEQRNMFKLKNEECKGIYDLLFIKSGNTNNFYMYLYRHRNIFVKIFTEQVGEYKEDLYDKDNNKIGETVYAQHNLLSSTNENIRESDFFIGEAIKTKKLSKSSKENPKPIITLEEAVLNYMTKHNVTTASLLDHVTGLPVCFFSKNADGTIKTHTSKSEGNNIPIFKILKNYILYITPGIYVSEQAIQV